MLHQLTKLFFTFLFIGCFNKKTNSSASFVRLLRASAIFNNKEFYLCNPSNLLNFATLS